MQSCTKRRCKIATKKVIEKVVWRRCEVTKKVQNCDKKKVQICKKKKVIEKVVWCRCKVTRPERVKWQWVKSGERHSTVGSGDTREEEAKITTRKRNSTSTSSTNY